MAQPELPRNSALAGKVIEGHYQNEQARIDRGLIGNLFGGRNSVPANVAAIIALISGIALTFAALYWAGSAEFGYKDAISALSGLVTLTVGYLFGRSSRD